MPTARTTSTGRKPCLWRVPARFPPLTGAFCPTQQACDARTRQPARGRSVAPTSVERPRTGRLRRRYARSMAGGISQKVGSSPTSGPLFDDDPVGVGDGEGDGVAVGRVGPADPGAVVDGLLE